MFINQGGLAQTTEGTAVDFGEHMLSGGWQIDEVLPYPEAVISRGYADTRYLRQAVDLTAALSFASSHTATGGMLRAYIPWAGQGADLFTFDDNDECIVFSTLQNVPLRIGGVTTSVSGIEGYGCGVGFEDNTLFGPWKLNQVTDNSLALLNRSYADSRYLRSDAQLDQPLVFTESLITTSGLFRAYFDPNGQYEDFFIVDGAYEVVRLSSTGNASLMVGDTSYGNGAIAMSGSGNRIYLEDGLLDGHWTVNNPTVATEIVNRGYADSRYLMRTEGITTNRVIQAGDTLVISNGLITAINP
jgi:hypothetical protein